MYQRASEQGNGQAAHNLALLLLKRNKKGDYARAVELLKNASKIGVPESMTELGVLYVHGSNMRNAFKLFEQAAEKQV